MFQSPHKTIENCDFTDTNLRPSSSLRRGRLALPALARLDAAALAALRRVHRVAPDRRPGTTRPTVEELRRELYGRGEKGDKMRGKCEQMQIDVEKTWK